MTIKQEDADINSCTVHIRGAMKIVKKFLRIIK